MEKQKVCMYLLINGKPGLSKLFSLWVITNTLIYERVGYN